MQARRCKGMAMHCENISCKIAYFERCRSQIGSDSAVLMQSYWEYRQGSYPATQCSVTCRSASASRVRRAAHSALAAASAGGSRPTAATAAQMTSSTCRAGRVNTHEAYLLCGPVRAALLLNGAVLSNSCA